MRFPSPLRLWQIKCAIWIGLPMVAAAAEMSLRQMDPSEIQWWTWVFILAFSVAGWAAADLDKLADVLFAEGRSRHDKMRDLFKFVSSGISAILAGVFTYFMAKVAPEWFGFSEPIPEMAILVAVGVAGLGGVHVLEGIRARFFPPGRAA